MTGTTLTIRTGARLHFGLFSDPRPQGRRHQGFGVMIDSPGFRIRAQTIECRELCKINLAPHIPQDWYRSRIQDLLERCQQLFPVTGQCLHLDILEGIPPHTGLGSGTQLDLAVADLWLRLAGQQIPIPELAHAIGRGKRSTIGTYGYEQGGLLIDQGIRSDSETGSCRFRAELPAEWRFLLVTPQAATGISGQYEREAFSRLSPPSASDLEKLERFLANLENHPCDFDVLSETLRDYGHCVGDLFASVQGGRFCHPACFDIEQLLNEAGLVGIAQSSWGPTMAGLCRSAEQAQELQLWLNSKRDELTIHIAAPRNRGREWD